MTQTTPRQQAALDSQERSRASHVRPSVRYAFSTEDQRDRRHMSDSLRTRLKSKASVLLKNPYINALRGAPLPQVTGEDAQLAIARAIIARGQLVARVGATEGETIAYYLRKRTAKSGELPPYPDKLLTGMQELSGFFPCTNETLDQISIEYLRYIEAIDIYAAWTSYDRHLCPRGALRCRLIDLDPFFTTNRWTLALEGLRVTVVSPFKASILAQYQHRERLFAQPTLPDFSLSVVKAPLTFCGEDVGKQNWYANLCTMDSAVAQSKPDVVIIGAGAYGLPLASMAKARGNTAIMLGGATQLLFGIIGSRWLNDPQYRAIFNEYWRRPGEEEKPARYRTHEIAGGAYW
jgi:hypothetical protein